MQPEEQSKLNRLKDALYSRTQYVPDDPIQPLKKTEHTAPSTWQNIPELPVRPGIPFIKIVIWFSVVFFVVAASVAGYLFYSGYNTISASNVNLVLSGPTTVAGGEDMTLNLTIENRNTVAMQEAYLVVEYPEGARKTIDSFEPLVRERISVGSIASGAVVSKAIQAVFFGTENTEQKITFSVQYRVAESAGLFEKSTEYLFILGPAPVQVVMNTPAQLSSGQEITVEVEISSNTTQSLSNIAVQMQYPTGFSFLRSTPVATSENMLWFIGTLAPGEKRKISVTGKLEGPENESRAFRYVIGSVNPNNTREIATAYKTEAQLVTLQKPYIAFDLQINGENQEIYYVPSGSIVSVNMGVTNSTSEQLRDAIIEVQVHGAYLDPETIRPGQGFFQTATNIISWDRRQVSALTSIDPGGRVNVQYTFGTIPFSKSAFAQTNQPITITATVKGTRTINENRPEQIASSVVRQIKFLSEAAITSETLYSEGPITNRGPIPPKAEQETTYTIVWTLTNTYNALTNGQVKAILPSSYVQFSNVKSPTSEQLVYNPSSGELVWNVGTVAANTGYGSMPRQVAFQVSIIPSRTQIGTSPELVGSVQFTAIDQVTNQQVSARASGVSIQMPTDNAYRAGQGVVTQ